MALLAGWFEAAPEVDSRVLCDEKIPLKPALLQGNLYHNTRHDRTL